MSLDNIINMTDDNVTDRRENRDRVRVISEENNTANIAVESDRINDMVRGKARRQAQQAARPGDWDAFEYGVSEAQVLEQLAKVDTPEEREKILRDMMERAVKRANLAEGGGKIMLAYSGEVAWHQLGTHVSGAMSSSEALAMSGLDNLDLRKIEQHIDWNGERIATGCYAVVRVMDDGSIKVLTEGKSVGGRYEIVGPEECFGLLDTLGDKVRFESCGAIGDGEALFMLTDIPGAKLAIDGDDEIEGKLMCYTRNDGVGAVQVFPTTHRPLCANTTQAALLDWRQRKTDKRCLSFRHTKNVRDRIEQGKEAIRRSTDALEKYGQEAQFLASQELANPMPYFDGCLDYAIDTTVAEVKVTSRSIADGSVLDAITEITEVDEKQKAEKSFVRAKKRRQQLLDDILNRYETDRCKGSTGWSAYNAVTESVDHGKMRSYRGDETERQESRFKDLLNGRGADVKEYALESALETVSA